MAGDGEGLALCRGALFGAVSLIVGTIPLVPRGITARDAKLLARDARYELQSTLRSSAFPEIAEPRIRSLQNAGVAQFWEALQQPKSLLEDIR